MATLDETNIFGIPPKQPEKKNDSLSRLGIDKNTYLDRIAQKQKSIEIAKGVKEKSEMRYGLGYPQSQRAIERSDLIKQYTTDLGEAIADPTQEKRDTALESFFETPFSFQMAQYVPDITGLPTDIVEAEYAGRKFRESREARGKGIEFYPGPLGMGDRPYYPDMTPEEAGLKLQQGFAIGSIPPGIGGIAGIAQSIIGLPAKAMRAAKTMDGQGIAGIGHNQGPPMFDKGIASVMSDDVARKIFTVDEEMDVLYDLNQRKRRLENKNLMDDNLTDQQRNLLYKEEEALNEAISKVQEKVQEKIKKRFATNVQGRTIPELDPKLQDNMSMETVIDAAVGDKNKNILRNVSSYIDSPGFDKVYQQAYGTTKFSTQLNKIFKNSEKAIDDPEYLSEYTRLMTSEPQQKVGKKGIASLNPLEMYEKSISPPTTMSIGSGTKPFFVNPQKLADKLDKSGAGEDFFKLRTGETGYLDNLEYSIMKQGYKPSPIQIEIYPSGNTAISEGNHRLYRALSRGDKEVPVVFYYTGGAERLNTPFGINQLDSFLAEGEKGYKTAKEYAKYIKDVEKTYKIK